jgi:hypothetical protein
MATANAINADTAGLVGYNGSGTFTGTATTQYNVIVGGSATDTIANVSPSSTSGMALTSAGSSANPTFANAVVVAGGGTGQTTLTTAYGLLAAGTTATGVVQTLPTGTSGQILVSGGSSALPAFATYTISRQVFSTAGATTYTPTTGMKYVNIEVVGGGGGSGGCASTGASTVAASGGGGGGGYAVGFFSAATVGASQSITVGARGSAGSSGNNNGGAGGTSSITGLSISATGGSGGTGAAATTAGSSVSGGEGGAGSGGDFQVGGQSGGPGIYFATTLAQGGNGGGCLYGGGALGFPGNNTAQANTNYGVGAAGGSNLISQSAQGGAQGGTGLIVCTEYIW